MAKLNLINEQGHLLGKGLGVTPIQESKEEREKKCECNGNCTHCHCHDK